MSTKGYVYVLSNPAFSWLKIGRSKHGGQFRADVLSKATGLPKPFKLEYEMCFDDAAVAEKAAHRSLQKHRVDEGREFFDVSIEEAIQAIENPTIDVQKPSDTDDYYDQEIIGLKREVVILRSTNQSAKLALGVSDTSIIETPKFVGIEWNFMARMHDWYGVGVKLHNDSIAITPESNNERSCFILCAYKGYFDWVDVSSDETFYYTLGKRSTQLLLANGVIKPGEWE